MALIGRFEHLPNRPRSAEARPLLEKIASQVKPIMVKHGWKVGTLAEFLPSNPALLGNNMNSGQRINLRLRPPGDTSNFYDYEQLVLVMLHELTHNVHGPHDAKFYKLLGELEEEFYDLKRKGYEGEGFHSAGHHLQGLRVNEYEGRRKGLAAAEKRLQTQKAMGKGGVLGGSVRNQGKTMREIVAEAAERRIQDDKACDTTSAEEVEAEVRKAQEESVGVDATDIRDESARTSARTTPPSSPRKRPLATTPPDVIDLTDDSPSPPRTSKDSRPPKQPAREAPRPLAKPAPGPALPTPKSAPAPKEWTCSTCTLINPIAAATCEVCTSPRPALPPSADAWFCDFCGAGPREMGFWSCAECGWVRKWG